MNDLAWTMILSTTPTETENIGRRLAKLLPSGAVVPLFGNLGTGKSVLCRGIARGLGIEEPVTSPTFTVVQEYQAPGSLTLFHIDMYRIPNEEDALAFGIEEYLFAEDAITLVEWPERIAGLLEVTDSLKNKIYPIHIEHAGEEQRRLRIPGALAKLARLTPEKH